MNNNPKINHTFDCSISRSDICDCGAFRSLLFADSKPECFWELWAKHKTAIDETYNSVNQQILRDDRGKTNDN